MKKKIPTKKEDDKMKMKDEKDHDKMAHMRDDDKMYMDKGEYSDVISSEYLSWMENTLKSAGVDTDGARLHFDQLEKAQLGGFDNPHRS